MSPMRSSRRGFLSTILAAASAPAFLRAASPNGKLNVAVIGCGGRGSGNLQEMAGENVVAVCDVFQPALDAAVRKFPGAKQYPDFRRLFDDEKSFDAVVVSTAEHTHAFATLPALKLRKHVYCEKPLTHSIWEAREIRKAAREAKVATQMGTQIHATANYRRVVELIRGGAVGTVREVHVWVSRAWGVQSSEAAARHKDIVTIQNRPSGSSPIPAGLDWDLWLGPAPERPFHEIYFPGPKWYRWWDFGSGTMSDLGSHWNDLPFWALDLDAPTTIRADGPPPHAELAPASMSATYEYPARGPRGPVRLTWYQGEMKPRIWEDRGIPQWSDGALFIGDQGMVLADYGKHVLLPEGKFKDYQRPAPSIPESLGHHQEWIHACKTGSPTTCHFEYAGALTEANHLGNVAYRTGRVLEWDASGLVAKGVPEAGPLIRREYRKGWVLGG
ncbi:MAG: Gfo/Idh/MocA family oxidoreductase, partial [Verrucomicrobiales bacterium]|nr:Gfo/Idh/MocA family oxidoreductase [Verrucomicrobiales bacterium]